MVSSPTPTFNYITIFYKWKNKSFYMDRGAWWATVHGVARVGHHLATKPPQCNTSRAPVYRRQEEMVMGDSQMRDPKGSRSFASTLHCLEAPDPALQLLAQHFQNVPKAPESRVSKIWTPRSLPSVDDSLRVFYWPHSTPVFTAAPLARARKRKKPECPSTKECIKKMWYM